MNQVTPRAHTPARRAGFSWTAAAGLAVAGAAALAAVGNYRAAKRAERRNPPRGDFVELDGVRLHYIERGHGPTVVLIHGLAGGRPRRGPRMAPRTHLPIR